MKVSKTSTFYGVKGKNRYSLAQYLMREVLKNGEFIPLAKISEKIGLSPLSLGQLKKKNNRNSKIFRAFDDMLCSGEIEQKQYGKRIVYGLNINYLATSETSNDEPVLTHQSSIPLAEKAQKILEALVKTIIEMAREDVKDELQTKDAEITALKDELQGKELQKEEPLVQRMFNFKTTK